MSAGMKSVLNTPLLGLAFLISAITAAPPAATLARIAPTKSRVSTRDSASARMAASDFFLTAAAISCRLTATIWFRMSLMVCGRLSASFQDFHKNAVQAPAHHDKQQRHPQGNPGSRVTPHPPAPQATGLARRWATDTSCSSLALAAPLARAWLARVTPSASEGT